jgi:hypothetical protein
MQTKCSKCNGRLLAKTTVNIEFPAEWIGNINKQKIKSPEFKLSEVNWEGLELVCRDCGTVQENG